MQIAAGQLIKMGAVLSFASALTFALQQSVEYIQKLLSGIKWDENTVTQHILGKKDVKAKAPNCTPQCIIDCALEGTKIEGSEKDRESPEGAVQTHEVEKVCPHGINWVVRITCHSKGCSIATGWIK